MGSQRIKELQVVTKATRDSTLTGEQVALFKADGTPYPIPTKQAAQADTTAADLAALKVDFNLLLAKLRLAGILS